MLIQKVQLTPKEIIAMKIVNNYVANIKVIAKIWLLNKHCKGGILVRNCWTIFQLKWKLFLNSNKNYFWTPMKTIFKLQWKLFLNSNKN